jgi:hypothetical protein
MADALGRQLPDPDELPEGEEPVVCWATIIKEKSEDDMIEVDPQYLHTRIAVNLRSTTYASLYNTEKKKYHAREIIYKVYEPDHFIPTELLDIELDS